MKIIVYFLLIFLYLPCLAQKMPDIGMYNVHITDTDRTINTQVNPVFDMAPVKADLDYYWYGSARIHILQGGYSGKLLNGTYNEYYTSKNLKSQGFFQDGLKNRIWKDWNINGKLIKMVTWRAGVQTGRFSNYDQNGKLAISGYYRNNLLDGPIVYNINADSTKTVIYKEGKIITEKHIPFLKRVKKIFKKKASAS